MAIISLKSKVLYLIWKKRGFEANYNNLSRALGYQDERRIRDAVNDSLEEGTLEVKDRNGRGYWVATNRSEQTIGLLILPLTQIIIVAVLGGTVLASGLDEYFFGYRIPPVSLAGLGVFIIAICAVFWYLQSRLEARIWEVERKKASGPEGQPVTH